jgi:low affinity Fe/Cu permease
MLHRMSELMAHSASGLAASAFVLAWVAVGIATGFPGWWATVLYSTTSSVTFVMVFVIQHTQARQTAATQLKLDELIRTSIRADDGLIAVEEAPDAHLSALTEQTVAEREWT